MTTTTISLERSAYELLKAQKRPHESFSEALHRLLGGASPELKGFLQIVPPGDGEAIAEAIEAIRSQDLAVERRRSRRPGETHGRRT